VADDEHTFFFAVPAVHLPVAVATTMPTSSSAPLTSAPPASASNANSASNSPSPGGSVPNSAATASTLSIPQSAPAGGITMLTPAQTATSYYKLAPSQPITFGWNFTYLFTTPTHLTVSAVCDNGNTYPVGPTDGVIPGTATSVVWDAYAWNEANPGTPLAQATYTLNVWDDRGRTAVRAPGLFSPNSALHFALYSPQAYTPLASGASPFLSCRTSRCTYVFSPGWQCSGCNSGALARATAHPGFAALIMTLVVCLLSGYGLLRRTAH
jgi:hypothetical protein